MFYVDLNCDLGESFGRYTIGNDEKVLHYVTSVNIACGFHAGDPMVMRSTVKKAIEKEVAIGAHPGYPDLMGFGRRDMNIDIEEAKAYMTYQIGALKAFVESYGGKLQHVKPHGALYNRACKDYKLARALTEAVYDIDSEIIFMGLSNSIMIKAANDVGLRAAHEVFADRAYNSDCTLVSRKLKGSVIYNIQTCVKRVLRMIKEGKVKAIDGTDIEIKANSICIHGDNSMALEFAKSLRQELEEEDIVFKPLINM